MLRFSDRLTSTSTASSEPTKAVTTPNGSSDVKVTDSTLTTDHEYIALVDVVGLHQTVKVLEAEYNLLTGGDIKIGKDFEMKLG
jgi:hypothetical protein